MRCGYSIQNPKLDSNAGCKIDLLLSNEMFTKDDTKTVCQISVSDMLVVSDGKNCAK